MTAPASRRGFLRDLVGLPLIGGGLTLIGAPVASAAPVTPLLLREYHDWLMYERSNLIREIEGENRTKFGPDAIYGTAFRWHRARGEFRPSDRGELMGDGVSFPSTRAALVLSAVGCGWEART